jgi:hypothetical protein
MATAATEMVEVRNRWTNRVQFTAEIVCRPDASIGVKLGLAVKWARKSDADLRGADLRGADLRGADLRDADLRDAVLSGADLSGADLRGADLRGAVLRGAVLSGADLSGADLRDADLRDADLSDADLRGAVLRSFKADLWMTLTQAQAEVPALIAALRAGKVNGSQYEGDCACLVGTLANARGEGYRAMFPDASSRHPAEQWFLMIREGDRPGDDTGGGFAAEKALEWALEYCALTGINPEPAAAIAA